MKFVAPILLATSLSANAATLEEVNDAIGDLILDLTNRARDNLNQEQPPVQSNGTSSINFNDYISGSWYNPTANGIGLNIEVHGNFAVAYVYMQDEIGTPMWLICQGERVFYEDQNAHMLELPCYMPAGTGDNPVTPLYLMYAIAFHDCDNGTIFYVEADNSISGKWPIQRLTPAWGSCQ